MDKFSRGIVKSRFVIFIISLVLLIPSFFGYISTRVNYDVLSYLPKDIETMVGQDVLMDDFGSGYSSLNMLKEAPVDEIKLDMRFLSAADPYGRAEEILHMIITMGNHMKLSIIAEGVETEQQKVMLQGFGCNKAQGYFYARPMREAEYTELLRKDKAEN